MTKRKVFTIFMMCLVLLIFNGCSQEQEKKLKQDVSISGKTEVHYTQRDLAATYESGQKIQLSDSVTITEAGTYILSGTLEGEQVIVDADENAKVQLVLDGVSVTSKDGPAIWVKSADKVFLTLSEGSENHIADSSEYSSDEDEPWGAIFSKDDLTINGNGGLCVEGNHFHGIVSKDSLKITGGQIDVTAVEDGMRGRDEIAIHSGNLQISAGEDGLKANNDEEEGKGNISIDGGTVSVSGTKSQGLDAYNLVQLLGGKIDITTENEGIQGEVIYIADGDVQIDAADDCLNAKDSAIDDSETLHRNALLEIAGGNLVLSTSAGDGLDSNGNIKVTGGSTIIHGSSGGVEVPLDYNGTAEITGGTVLGSGNIQMAQNFSSESTQCSLLYATDGVEKDTRIRLLDKEQKEIISWKPANRSAAVLISAPGLKTGETYTLYIGETSYEVTLSDRITTIGGNQSGRRGPGRERMPMFDGEGAPDPPDRPIPDESRPM